jgi:hypothetical protein
MIALNYENLVLVVILSVCYYVFATLLIYILKILSGYFTVIALVGRPRRVQ